MNFGKKKIFFYLQWNNWVQIIKMRKIQGANQNLPSVPSLSNKLSLSASSVPSLAFVGACISRAGFAKWKRDTWR